MLIKRLTDNNGNKVILFTEEFKRDYLINSALCLLEDCSSYNPINNKEGGKNEQNSISIKIR